MLKKLTFLFLLSGFVMTSQTKNDEKTETFTSRKEIYQIKYNPNHWIKKFESQNWDAEFHDKYNLVTAYFIEYDYFVSNQKIKNTLEDQFKEFGKIKKVKFYKKRINNIEVNYFECELNYNSFLYKYQGFFYNGKGGTVQIQYGGQDKSIEQNLSIIEEFNNGFSLIE
ncbi:hypothetical protein [Flavobacterium tistrianum]|uniref:hypothetical protein n=1 Tax=Flavobacterium tistrianum TaxID=1685414 RepID=UPI000DAF433D|nr:hypothetical protein [Flavobacterium tistrianum]KAF2341486.1 hypothetical protein DMB71_08555 [Flavobacterium tistrianum]